MWAFDRYPSTVYTFVHPIWKWHFAMPHMGSGIQGFSVISRTTVAVAVLTSSLSTVVVADENESCGDILRYASRDVRHSVSFSDQRKFYFQKVCKSGSSGVGIDYKDAASALGLSYSSKDEYCKSEQSFDNSTSYDQIDSSVVVRSSLDAYVACRALSAKGVATSLSMPPGDTPTVFSISVQRRSPVPQTIDSLTIDPATVACNSLNKGQVQSFDNQFNSIGFELPQSEAQWSLVCVRKASTEPEGNRSYGPVQLILTTSSGALPISLPAVGYAAGAWAAELRNETSSLAQKIGAAETRIANQKVVALCGGDGYFPRPNAPACPAGFKDSGQFTHSAPGGAHGYGGHCRVCLGN